MEYKWELLEPNSGSLVATANPEAATRCKIGWRLFCVKCKEYLNIPYDELDSKNIVNFVEKQKKRKDCKG